jgi:hypothetical protein
MIITFKTKTLTMIGLIKQALAEIGKYVAMLMGGLAALLEPAIPFMVVCTLAVLCNSYTVIGLSRRIKSKYPTAKESSFRSNYAEYVFSVLIKIYALIVLVFLVEGYVFEGLPVKLSNIVAGAVCFWQIWSMLEHEISCNDARWAKIAQRILVDKTERYFNIDLRELKEGKEAVDAGDAVTIDEEPQTEESHGQG